MTTGLGAASREPEDGGVAAAGPLVRVVDASLGADAQLRLVVSHVSRPERLRVAWSSSGAVLDRPAAPAEPSERIAGVSTADALARAAGRSLPQDEARALDRRLREAVTAWSGPPPAWRYHRRGPGRGDYALPVDTRPLVMGIVNVTPDSFADGGLHYPDGHPGAAVAHGERLLQEGADLLDVGGESTRPGAAPVPAQEELQRVLPVVSALARAGAVVSIDTTKAAVAEAALDAGAVIVNDTSAAASKELLAAVARAGAGYVLMHSRGTPADMQTRTEYADVVAEVHEFLLAGLERCMAAGIERDRIAIDPGIGFAKTAAHNLTLLRGLRQLRALARPLLVGASRKSFLGAPLGGGDAGDRLEASLAVAALAVARGAAVLRVHDVAATVRAARAARAVATGATDWP